MDSADYSQHVSTSYGHWDNVCIFHDNDILDIEMAYTQNSNDPLMWDTFFPNIEDIVVLLRYYWIVCLQINKNTRGQKLINNRLCVYRDKGKQHLKSTIKTR